VGFLSVADDFVDTDLSDLYAFLKHVIHKGDYSSIKMYCHCSQNNVRQTPVRFTLYPLDHSSFDVFAKGLGVHSLDNTQ
jgi:hypothetical protein